MKIRCALAAALALLALAGCSASSSPPGHIDTVVALSKAAGCAKVRPYTPTKPAHQGADCTLKDGQDGIVLLTFTDTASRDVVLKRQTNATGVGDDWLLIPIYEGPLVGNDVSDSLADAVAKATKRAGGTLSR